MLNKHMLNSSNCRILRLYTIISRKIMKNQQSKKPLTIVDFRYEEQIRQILQEKCTIDQLEELRQLSYSTDVIERHKGIIGIRKILSASNDHSIETIMNLGILPILKDLIAQRQFPQLKLQAAWILSEFTTGTNQQCRAIVELGAIPLFIDLLKQKETSIIQQGIWAIGNISTDCVQHRNAAINAGGVKALIEVLQRYSNQNMVKHCGWALSCLCRGSPFPSKQMIPNSGAVPLLIQLVEESQLTIKVPVLRILTAISTGGESQTNLLIVHGLMPKLAKLLSHVKLTVRREACHLISNIAAGTMDHVEAIIKNEQIIKKLIQLFGNSSKETNIYLCRVFKNICANGNPAEVFSVINNHRIFGKIIPNLDEQDLDLINAALECIKVTLLVGFKHKNTCVNPFAGQFKEFGGMEHFQRLKCHHEDAVYQRICIIQQILSSTND